MYPNRRYRVGNADFEIWFSQEKSVARRNKDARATSALRALQARLPQVPTYTWCVGYLGRNIWIGDAKLAEGVRGKDSWLVHSLKQWGLGGREMEVTAEINQASN